MTPHFASGPGAGAFSGIEENREIGGLLLDGATSLPELATTVSAAGAVREVRPSTARQRELPASPRSRADGAFDAGHRIAG